LTAQNFAFALISMNFSALVISVGILFHRFDTCMDTPRVFICFGST